MITRYTIWKYTVPARPGAYDRDVPGNNWAMSVQMQRGHIAIWMSVNPDGKSKKKTFVVRATGEDYDFMNEDHIGTVLDGELVWHVFMIEGDADDDEEADE